MARKQKPLPADAPVVIIIGAGLAGLVAAFELTQRGGVRVVMVDQENAANLGGQAFWSLGGLFCVDSRNQRRMGIRDSHALALRDWLGSARFGDGANDHWPRRWAEAFVRFATDEMERYVGALGLRFLFNVGWAERGDGTADGHGNSVPRFHVTWGAGPEVVRIFAEPVLEAEKAGLVEFRFRHAVDQLLVDEKTGAAIGVRGRVLEQHDVARGVASSRKAVGDFELFGSAVLIASGGIGGNVEAVKAAWPLDRLGPTVPQHLVVGVPAHVDGRMIGIAEGAGANIINRSRMWHYTEGLANWAPIWPGHGIRVLPGPSSLWLDATGKRLPFPFFPGCDTLGTLEHICHTGHHYTWFVLDRAIVAKEFALSGSEQNPDLSDKDFVQLLRYRVFGKQGTPPVQNFVKHGADFVVRDTLAELVTGMNELAASTVGAGAPKLHFAQVRAEVDRRDAQMDHAFAKDAQAMLVHNARAYWPDARSRVAVPHRLVGPDEQGTASKAYGPLIAVRMNLLTRKTLGGIETDLQSRVQRAEGEVFPGLYAAGEVAGFGGGGVHGHASLEGTFLGGCIFSGRAAGRAMADEVLGKWEQQQQ